MMEVVRLDAPSAPRRPRPAVAVGNFDGVHRGHQALVASAVAAARGERGHRRRPHLRSASRPRDRPRARAHCAHDPRPEGGDPRPARRATRWPCCPSRPRWRRPAPRSSRAGVLHRALGADTVVVGDNFRFGRGRAGDVGTLRRQGESLGFRVVEVPPVVVLGERVSSSRIREALARGDARGAAELLGPPLLHRRPRRGGARAGGGPSASPPPTSSRPTRPFPPSASTPRGAGPDRRRRGPRRW